MPSPTPTILLLSLPPSILCSINLLSFTTAPSFHGIKNLSPGYHFIFTSETTSHSIRDGFWFYIPTTTEPALRVRKWDGERGGLVGVGGEEDGEEMERYRAYVGEVWERGLMPYRQIVPSQDNAAEVVEEVDHWAQLTRHITARVLTHLTKNKEWRITSASSALVDRDEIPGLQVEEVFEEGEGEDVKEEMEALEGFLRREYGWELGDEFVRRGMLQLDDGEMVEMEMEEMEGEDERGEYAPVVVDLDNP
ncbi:hypothetical protein JMJ35_009113 [Cladonia borealis]|uniref:AAR2 N-terminal domain-containing protein n=1 Tax=Cladonia borealis TaxID=184061 RepID=A0AA39QTB1_9LECA|nr:hypothetical protein JMJ35_009113 [Cladonia borealis]